MRTKIVRLTVLLAAVTLAVFGVPLGVTAARYMIDQKYLELEREADTAAIAVAGDLNHAVPYPSGTDLQISIYDRTGVKLSGPGPAADIVTVALTGTADTGAVGDRMGAASPITDGDEVVGAALVTGSSAAVYLQIGLTWLMMLGLGGAALIVAWLLARRQAQRLSDPLQELSIAAQRLGRGDFAVRTRAAGIPEIDSVSESINGTAARLGSLLERERAFTADASHQLRTPLTGLRLHLEAALDDPAADPSNALAGALEAVDRLQQTVDQLLRFARTVPPASMLDVDRMLEDVDNRWHAPLSAKGRPLRLSAPGNPQPWGSPAAVDQILDVLIDNADRHGIGAISILVRELDGGAAIDVTDEGPALLDTNLLRSASPTNNGHGRGLALARRLAEAQGGRLLISRPKPPTFSLILPAREPDAQQDQAMNEDAAAEPRTTTTTL